MENDLIIVDVFDDEIVLDSFIYDKDSDNILTNEKFLKFFEKVNPHGDMNLRIRRYKRIK